MDSYSQNTQAGLIELPNAARFCVFRFHQSFRSVSPDRQALSEARFFQFSQSEPPRPGSERKFSLPSGHTVFSPIVSRKLNTIRR